jgi:tryptophan synthase alpha chain
MSTKALLMTHMVAFYPDRASSLQVARGLVDGGCAYLEVQFPFSDPTADGPDIQAACDGALRDGFTVAGGFRLVSEIAGRTRVPLFIMSYANLLFTRGIERFLTESREAGARGVIVPDLPEGYDEGLFGLARRLGLAAVPVVSPSMKDARLQQVSCLQAEYVYATLRTGTTGSRTEIDQDIVRFLSRIRAGKVLGGFGISSAEQVRAVAPLVHAVVVGSALVREAARGGDTYGAVRRKVEELRG